MAQNLANILGMLPVSDRFLGRMAFDGSLYGLPSPNPRGLEVSEDHPLYHQHEDAMIQLRELVGNPSLPDYSVPGASLAFTEPLFKFSAQGKLSTPADAPTPFQKIKTATFADLSNGLLTAAEKLNPLALLIRHSMLLAYLDTAYNLNRLKGFIQSQTHRDPALIGILTDPATNQAEVTPTLLGLLVRAPKDLGLTVVGNTLRDVIHTLTAHHHSSAKILEDMRGSLTHLATVAPSQLQGLLSETLDLTSHRLDAWVTSLATVRLDSLRQKKPQGLIVGGYGWVENLKLKIVRDPTGAPIGFGDRILVQQVPTGEGVTGQPLYEKPSNGGYVTAPSINQAATAAILRSGYLNAGDQTANAPFAINLSSERVRLGQWLLDGVRQGQSLGALLGYRFERGLQEKDLAQYILPVRKLVPFGEVLRSNLSEANFITQYCTTHLTPTSLNRTAIESIEAQHVVDGLELMHLWQAGKLVFGTAANQLNVQSGDRPTLEAQLNQLVATVDAVSDLITAESVYQLTMGNDLVAGDTLDAIATGTAPPPNPAIVRTPRTGIAHTHRIPVVLAGTVPTQTLWGTDAYQRRAGLEAGLNHWLGLLFGDPSRFRIQATYWDPQTDTPIQAIRLQRLSDFRLSPLDIVFLASTNETGTGSALENFIRYILMRSRPANIPAHATLRFSYDRDPSWLADQLGLGTLNELARAAREMITQARALTPEDLASPETQTTRVEDAAELTQRANGIVKIFRQGRTNLFTGINNAAAVTFNLDLLRTSIVWFSFVGLTDAVPVSSKNDEPAASVRLIEQAKSLLARVDRILAELDKLEASLDRTRATPAEKIRIDTQRIKLIMGEDFPVLPRFTPANANELTQTFGNSLALQNQDPLAALSWLGQMAHVRQGCDRLNTCLSYTELLTPTVTTRGIAGQLPWATGDRWVALPQDPARPMTQPRVAWMALAPNGLKWDAPLSGLLVDEWVETIPNAQEIAAAAFHFDAPQAQAPQAILLAVPPDTKPNWQLDTLEAILQEALELAKLRTVDNAALFESDRQGHFLPAAYCGFNLDSEAPTSGNGAVNASTVSTDFSLCSDPINQSAPPFVNSMFPTFGFVGESTDIAIYGDNLAEVQSITFDNGLTTSNLVVISNIELTCRVTIPTGTAPGFSAFEIKAPNGNVYSGGYGVSFEATPRPTLLQIIPAIAFNGDTITATISGIRIGRATQVEFLSSGLQVSNLVALNDSQLQCTIIIAPSTLGGSKLFQVVTPFGTIGSGKGAASFTVREQPTMTGIFPLSLPAGFSEIGFTIWGTKLTGVTAFRFFNLNPSGSTVGVSGRILSVSDTQVNGRISINRLTPPSRWGIEVAIPTGKNGVIRNSNLVFEVELAEPEPDQLPPRPGDPRPPTQPF